MVLMPIVNPQHACVRVLYSQFVCVCLSTSDFEDGSVFTFETSPPGTLKQLFFEQNPKCSPDYPSLTLDVT